MTKTTNFVSIIWEYYHAHGRHDLPWRQPATGGTFDPYRIVVSELMLQQTQVPRVIPKFEAFMSAYPSFTTLAEAPLAAILVLWSGLGYNRRAKFLWQLAQRVMYDYNGELPETREELVKLPGIGPNTAGAILAYAYNQPALFIETNIRTVYIHHFFGDEKQVADATLAPIIAETLPVDNPREWYWALMDYGTHLKQTVGNHARSSASYVKQSAFEGSRRQIRGQLLRLLADGSRTLEEIEAHITDERLTAVLHDLSVEGFLTNEGDHYQLRA